MKADTEKRRGARQEPPLRVLRDLFDGVEHDRTSVARKFEMEAANADRILKRLKALFPAIVVAKQGKRSVYTLSRAALLTPPDYPVAVAACFGSSLASLFRGTNYERGMRSAAHHLASQSRRARVFQHIERQFIFVRQGGEPSLEERAGEFDELVEAILKRRRVRFSYKSPSRGSGIRTTDPLSIAVYDHQLYIVGRDEKGIISSHRFSRTDDIEVLDHEFSYPSLAEYNPEEFFGNAFGIHVGSDFLPQRVVVRLAGAWAAYARTHRWHRSQQVSNDRDDKLDVVLQVPVCPEVETWILGFGELAEVLEPDSLKRRIAERVRAMSAACGSSASPPVD